MGRIEVDSRPDHRTLVYRYPIQILKLYIPVIKAWLYTLVNGSCQSLTYVYREYGEWVVVNYGMSMGKLRLAWRGIVTVT